MKLIIWWFFSCCLLIAQPSLSFLEIAFEKELKMLDLEKKAMLYIYNSKSEEMKKNIERKINDELGVNYNYYYVRSEYMNQEKYNKFCDTFNLSPYPNDTMFVFYFNNRAVQFPFDQLNDLSTEFIRLGWEPLYKRIDDFLKQNPYNHNALGLLFNRTLEKYNEKDLGSVINAFKIINRADSLEWMGTPPARSIFTFTLGFAESKDAKKYQVLKESPTFQKELNSLLSKIEVELKQNIYNLSYYNNWAALAKLAQNLQPDPRTLLSQINFPPGRRSVQVDFSVLANSLFFDGEMDKAFALLNDIEEWMDSQDIKNGTNFLDALHIFTMQKGHRLIEYKKYAEFEEYLEKMQPKLGRKWLEVSAYFKALIANKKLPEGNIKNSIQDMPDTDRDKIDRMLQLPAVDEKEKYFNAILILHNFPKPLLDALTTYLLQNKVNFYATQNINLTLGSWVLKNANIFVAEGNITLDNIDNIDINSETIKKLIGLIHTEERAYLNVLDKFIMQNPDNHEAMNMYCLEAEKFLPNDELENAILNYTAITKRPISLEAYSKMKNKDNWSRLVSKIIFEKLVKINDAHEGIPNPFSALGRWEDLDISQNAVDWYGYFKRTTFWHKPVYYMQKHIMPESVFIKFLRQAEKAYDWEVIIEACEVRFDNKKDCQNEWVLRTWEQAEKRK